MTSFTQIGWFGVGSFVSGGTATPNFARFAKDGKSGAITTVVAFFIGNSLMFFFGAVSSIFVGGNDIFEVMVRLNLFYLAVLVLGLNIWTTNDKPCTPQVLVLPTSSIRGKNRWFSFPVSSERLPPYGCTTTSAAGSTF